MTAQTTRKPAPERPKASTKVLAEAAKRGKVIEHPTAKDVAGNPGARGYDEHGQPRPADVRAIFLVVPNPEKPAADPSPADRGKRVRDARKAAAKARAAEARKAEKEA